MRTTKTDSSFFVCSELFLPQTPRLLYLTRKRRFLLHLHSSRATLGVGLSPRRRSSSDDTSLSIRRAIKLLACPRQSYYSVSLPSTTFATLSPSTVTPILASRRRSFFKNPRLFLRHDIGGLRLTVKRERILQCQGVENWRSKGCIWRASRGSAIADKGPEVMEGSFGGKGTAGEDEEWLRSQPYDYLK